MSAKTPVHHQSREAHFINYLIDRIQSDKGLAARLRRADNPATEYQSWELLARFGIDLEKEYERLPYATVAAALARSSSPVNGVFTLGQAIAACYEEGNESKQAGAKLRRVLACSDLSELCRILRPVLTLIDSRVGQPLDYTRILRQIRRFMFDPQQIKAQWAQEFYRRLQESETELGVSS